MNSNEFAKRVGKSHCNLKKNIRQVIGHLSEAENKDDYFRPTTFKGRNGLEQEAYIIGDKEIMLLLCYVRNREVFIREALPLIGRFNELESQMPVYGSGL